MTKKCTVTIEDEVKCRIGGLHPSDLGVLWEKFGIYVEGYRYMPQFQLRRWDGKTHYFDKEGRTYTKLLDEILPYLIAWDYDIDIDDRRLPAAQITDTIDADFFKLGAEFQFRDYQLNVVNQLLAAGSGFGICATGSGKTSMCAAICYMLAKHGYQTVVIVPGQDLVAQTVTEFHDRLRNVADGITIGSYSGSEKQIDNNIVVATWQSLQNAPHYMTYFQAFIVDECFAAGSQVLTPDGYMPIETLTAGSKVISYDELVGEFVIDQVIKLYKSLSKSKTEKMYRLLFDDETVIEVTGNHKFLTARGYVRADELGPDDEIVNTRTHS
jgi:hypothetical protein